MKALISIFIILVVVYGFMKLVGFYDRTARPNESSSGDWNQAPAVASAPVDNSASTGSSLPGLPSYLETSLIQAQQEGVEAFGKWLKTWHKKIQDPRLAWIELDYVVLLNLKDHKEARARFHEIKARIAPGSPVYDRLAKLESAYSQ